MNGRKIIITLLLSITGFNVVSAQNDFSQIFTVADNIIRNTSFKIINKQTGELYDNSDGLPVSGEYKIESPYSEWEYWNGVLALGMIRLSEISGDDKYKMYALRNYNFIFENLEYFGEQYKNKVKRSSLYQFFRMSLLDHCGAMSAGLCDVYQLDPKEEYRAYLNRVANYISNDELRLEDGTLIRSWPREMTLWADDLYMSVPFLARMSKITGNIKYMDDAILQLKNFNKYLYNENNGLYFHCYYSDNGQNGVAHWGRCNGWVLMAQVELINLLPENHPERDLLIQNLQKNIIGLSRYQDYNGMWHQLINKPDSYEESSATAMFVYGIAKAVNEGWINQSYATIALNGWKGLTGKIREDGQVEGICIGTGMQEDIKYYYDRPTKLNDIHGLGAVLLACAEMMKLDRILEENNTVRTKKSEPGFIANHLVAKENVIRSVPREYLDLARTELHIAYQHTSHGTHVSRGMFGLQDYKEGDESLFAVTDKSPQTGKLDFWDNPIANYAPEGIDASDLSRNEKAFVQATRNFLDDPVNAKINVVMWSWCDIARHKVTENYIPGMDSLIAEYGIGGSKIGDEAGKRVNPVTFIFMTGHANEGNNVGDFKPKNQAEIIVQNCLKKRQYCLDYYSIDSHDMNGGYWEDASDNGDSKAYGGNFYQDWQNAHQLGEGWYENKERPRGEVNFGAHNTQHITANRKAYALWWILARIAGWDGN